MAVIIDLSPDLENRLLEEAAREGQEAEDFVRDLITRRLRRRSRSRLSLTQKEKETIEALNAELTAEFWNRYTTLQSRPQDSLSSLEKNELLSLTQKTEDWNVRRLTLLEAIAQQRGLHFPELMKMLSIRHHPHFPS